MEIKPIKPDAYNFSNPYRKLVKPVPKDEFDCDGDVNEEDPEAKSEDILMLERFDGNIPLDVLDEAYESDFEDSNGDPYSGDTPRPKMVYNRENHINNPMDAEDFHVDDKAKLENIYRTLGIAEVAKVKRKYDLDDNDVYSDPIYKKSAEVYGSVLGYGRTHGDPDLYRLIDRYNTVLDVFFMERGDILPFNSNEIVSRINEYGLRNIIDLIKMQYENVHTMAIAYDPDLYTNFYKKGITPEVYDSIKEKLPGVNREFMELYLKMQIVELFSTISDIIDSSFISANSSPKDINDHRQNYLRLNKEWFETQKTNLRKLVFSRSNNDIINTFRMTNAQTEAWEDLQTFFTTASPIKLKSSLFEKGQMFDYAELHPTMKKLLLPVIAKLLANENKADVLDFRK